MNVVSNILEVESYINGYDAIVFDLDDTLYSEKEYVKSGFDAIARNFPTIENLNDKLWDAFLKKEPAIDVVFEELGLAHLKEEAIAVYRNHKPTIHLYHGVSEMLNRISQKKKIGIITDGRPVGQHNKINSLGLRVDRIIVTDELGGIKFRKPCVLAFEKMAKELNVCFDKMLYVGDNIVKDFEGPNKLGMGFVLFSNPDGLYYSKY